MNLLGIAKERKAPPEVAIESKPTASGLHTRYLGQVFGYVSRRAATVQEAEDVTAEVFEAAIQSLPRFCGRSSALTWLIGIARRKLADHERRRKRIGATVALDAAGNISSDPDQEPEAALAQAEARRVIESLVAGLTPDQREALMLQYADDLPIAEIAAIMRRSPASVNSLLQRARQAIFRKGHAYFLEESEETQ